MTKNSFYLGSARYALLLIMLLSLSVSRSYAQEDGTLSVAYGESAADSGRADEIEEAKAVSGSNTVLWAKGNEAYSVGDFKGALTYYSELENSGLASAPLYYNMGNAYYKTGGIGKAILYYERALKLNPSYSDAKVNLGFVRMQIADKIDSVPEFILVTWVRQLRDSLPSDGWGLLALLFLAAALVFLLVFRFSHRRGIKRLYFISACVLFFLTVVSYIFAMNLSMRADNSGEAIVTGLVGNVKSAPNTTGNSIFVLHEGTKVKILEEAPGWNRIEIQDGRQGWMRSGDIEVI